MIIGYFMTLIFLETQAPERYDSRLPTNSHYCLDGSKETFLVYGDTCASRSGEDDQRPLDYWALLRSFSLCLSCMFLDESFKLTRS